MLGRVSLVLLLLLLLLFESVCRAGGDSWGWIRLSGHRSLRCTEG